MESKSYTNSMYRDNLIKWISDKVYNFISHHNLLNYSNVAYMGDNLLFVTFAFNRKGITDRKSLLSENIPTGDIEFQQFSHFYNLVCKEILGRNFDTSPPMDKPLCIAGLDAEGSRLWKEMGPLENLHIHSIWVMMPGTKEKLLPVRERALSMDIFDFEHIDVRSFESGPGKSLSKLISYILKFDIFNQPEAEISDALRFYPLVKDGPRYVTASW